MNSQFTYDSRGLRGKGGIFGFAGQQGIIREA